MTAVHIFPQRKETPDGVIQDLVSSAQWLLKLAYGSSVLEIAHIVDILLGCRLGDKFGILEGQYC